MEKFKKIAMRCNQEQFDKIKPKLDGVIKFNTVFTDFEKEYPYLTNFYGDQKMGLGWRDKNLITSEEIHEQWGEKVFLEACGVFEEPKFEITKEQILELSEKFGSDNSCLEKHFLTDHLQRMFPEAFETSLPTKTIQEAEELLKEVGHNFKIV